MGIENEKTYDAVFKVSVQNMKDYLIPLVNEAFKEHFTEKAEVYLLPEKQETKQTDGSIIEREMDVHARMVEGNVTKFYHFELESTAGNKSFAIRIAEYAAGAAFGSAVLTETGAKMTIPYSAVIFLRSTDNTPDKLTIDIEYPGGTCSYEAPALKLKDYSVDELFDKRLYLLIPYYAFNLEKNFKKMDSAGIEELKEAYDSIFNKLSGMVGSGEIGEADRSHLLDWMAEVLNKLTYKHKNLREGVDALMTTYILRTRTDEILDQGKQQRDREKIEEMLRKGKTPEAIADFCGYPIELVKSVQESMKTQEAQEENLAIAN